MIEQLNLGPEPDLREPPELDPSLCFPLDESEVFFAELPARQPVRPNILIFTLLVHALAIWVLYLKRDKLITSPQTLKAAIERFASGEPGAGSRKVPVQVRPRFPNARMMPPASPVPPPSSAPST